MLPLLCILYFTFGIVLAAKINQKYFPNDDDIHTVDAAIFSMMGTFIGWPIVVVGFGFYTILK